jgi:hypothetical protein
MWVRCYDLGNLLPDILSLTPKHRSIRTIVLEICELVETLEPLKNPSNQAVLPDLSNAGREISPCAKLVGMNCSDVRRPYMYAVQWTPNGWRPVSVCPDCPESAIVFAGFGEATRRGGQARLAAGVMLALPRWKIAGRTIALSETQDTGRE